MKKIKWGIETVLLIICVSLINVNASTEKSIINIDTPNQSKYYGDKLLISGWSLSNTKNTVIDVQIDGISATNTYRWYREDVFGSSEYGTKNENPTPGYTSTIDLNDIIAGNHKISVINKNEMGQTLAQKNVNINIDNNHHDASIDAPDVNSSGNKIHIGGWALSSSSKAVINLYVDDEKLNSNSISHFVRQDVLNNVKGYMSSEFNKNCGYDTYYDASDLKDGNHTIKIEIVDDNKIVYKKTKVINLKKYSGIVNVDNPINNGYLSGKALIGGWIMSDCPNQEIIAKIDGVKISESINRVNRQDVLNAISGYGGKLTNSKPGYDFRYDVDSLSLENHTLSITLLNKNTGEEIGTANRNFKVKVPTTHLGIDSFINNSTIIGTELPISGWVMSEISDVKLEMYFDDELLSNPINRFKRSDVTKSIKDCGNVTTLPGYSTNFDMSKYQDGMHTVKFVVKNPTTGQVLYEENRNIKLKKHRGTSSIDSPSGTIKGTNLIVSGWYLSTDKAAKLKLYIDNKEITNIEYLNRSDVFKVIKEYGSMSDNPKAGYKVSYDVKTLVDGKHTIKLNVVNELTGEIIHESNRDFTLKKYETTGTFDSPAETGTYIGSTVNVNGWVMSEDKNITVQTYIDDKTNLTSTNRKQRSDVIKAISGYGGITSNPTPGYTSSIDVSGLTDGTHTVGYIVKDNITNEIIYSQSRKFILKKYDGKIGIDAPSSALFNNKSTSSLLIGGWALCQQEDSYLKVTIDGVVQNVTIQRYVRSDLNSVSSYGSTEKNPTAGFNTYINISHLVTGTHTLAVKLYNKENELISTSSKSIQLYDNVYPGIDVSYAQGTINWQGVANDGKTFAMIRLGYRGYGTGALAEDKQFRNNIVNASNSGVKVGLYFFSQATNYQEGVEEANFVLGTLNNTGYRNRVSFPIAFDTEYSTEPSHNGRADHISKQNRTEAAKGFLSTIANNGYTPMLYASKSWLIDNLDMLQLANYNVWLAHYTSGNTGILGEMSNYSGLYQIWQYTSAGKSGGINGSVDLNLAYKMY